MARLVPLALTAMFCASGAAAQCADWQNVSPGPRPPNRPSPVMTFDSGRNVTVAVFSYRSDADDLTDMYEYDGATWVHRLSGSLDGPRFGYSLTYDSLRAKTVFFGGYKGIGGGAQSTNTLALWDGTTMQVVGAADVWPPVNGKARAAFDPVRGRTIIICDEPASDAWRARRTRSPAAR